MLNLNENNLTVDKKINLAKISCDFEVLLSLAKDMSSEVRRTVARNENTTADILERLVDDPVLNVSYMASQNPKIKKRREFFGFIDHPCVICNNEIGMDCNTCEPFKSYK